MVILGLSHSKVEGTVNRNPCLYLHEVLEHLRSVYYQIANQRKLLHGLEGYLVGISNQCPNFLDERSACLSDAAVDVHRATATNFLKAGRFVRRRRDVFALNGHRFTLNKHQG